MRQEGTIVTTCPRGREHSQAISYSHAFTPVTSYTLMKLNAPKGVKLTRVVEH